MIEVDHKKFSELERALRDCVATAVDREGLKLAYATKEYSRQEIESAATIALMSLTRTWLRPKGVKFGNIQKDEWF